MFQGTADGRIVGYDGKSGELLWQAPLGNGAIAAPVSYMIAGRQFISIAVGWGGTDGQIQKFTTRARAGRVYTFALDANAPYPAVSDDAPAPLVSGVPYKHDDVAAGEALYVSHCVLCHGIPGLGRGGSVPNLGYVPSAFIANLQTIVFKGPMMNLGMPDFTGKLTESDVDLLKAYIQDTAAQQRAAEPAH